MGKTYFLPLLILLAYGHASAQVAVGGTSEISGDVYWLTWDNTTLDSAPLNWDNNNLVRGTYVWYCSDEIRFTATIEPSSGNSGLGVRKYTPGEWKGDGLRYMYEGEPMDGLNTSNGVPFSGLFNFTYGDITEPFDIAITLEFLIEEAWEDVDYPGISYEYIEVAVLDNDIDLQTDSQGESTVVPSSLTLVNAFGNPVDGNKLVTDEGTFEITNDHGISIQSLKAFYGKTASIAYVVEDEAGLLSEPGLLTIEVGRPKMVISNPILPHRSN